MQSHESYSVTDGLSKYSNIKILLSRLEKNHRILKVIRRMPQFSKITTEIFHYKVKCKNDTD